uniref:CSON010315 protein n=1 Tax=Culicoides sonorensis TaxID=179676 RepID=A0A336M1L1_CULSO
MPQTTTPRYGQSNPPLLYTTFNDIRLVNNTGKHNKPTFQTITHDLSEAGALDVFFEKQLVCWTDQLLGAIECMKLNGTSVYSRYKPITKLDKPDGIAFDWYTSKIYWTDSGKNRIEVVTYVPNKLFWTDWEHGTVHSYNLMTNKLEQLLDSEASPLAIRAWDENLQPKGNDLCGINNGNCSHLCLLSSTQKRGYSCACPTGIKLINDFQCADGPEEMLFIAQRTSINKVSLDTPDHTLNDISLGEVKYAIAIDYDPLENMIYWSDEDDWDEKRPKIERSSLDGTERVVLVSTELGWPNGITLDIERRKIYWCDAKEDKIEVANMDGSERMTVISETLPHPFGLSLMGDYLYWTDWQRRTIDRAHKINGHDRSVVIDQLPELMGLRAAHLYKSVGTNECANNNGGCNQLCFQRPTSYVCRCQIEYELSKDKKTCVKPDAFLLFSRLDSIGRISIEYNDENHNDYIPFKDMKDAHYFDIDVSERRVYWIDQRAKCISRAFINGSNSEKVIDSGILKHEGIAVDWIGRNIYWTDAESRRIEVARLDGQNRRALIWKGIEDPKNLVLEPKRGFMYWTEWSPDIIRRAAMDGSDMTTIISAASHPSGLTFDHETRKLYWARQSQGGGIESCDWDGKKRTRVLYREADDTFNANAVAIYEDFLYWSDWNTGNIEKIHKISGYSGGRTLIHKNVGEYVNALQIFHPSKQTGANACARNNGGCSHLCLALPGNKRMTCACPTHYTLAGDGTTCIPPRNYLIYSQKNAFGRLLPNTSDAPDTPLPVNAKNVRAVEFDPINQHLYWIDGRSSTIKQAKINGSKPEIFVPGGSQPFDLAIDIVGRLLFWSCSRANSINITSLSDGSNIGNVDVGESKKPRSIAIHTIKRLLFWTDAGSQQAIYRSRLDGSDRVQLISKLEGVTTICVDPQLNLVFYAHGKKIDAMDLRGKSKRNLVKEHINQVISLAPYEGILYWLDDKTGLERIFLSGDGRRPELQRLPAITDIVSIWMPDQKVLENHICYGQGARCTHICIDNPDFKGDDTCGCPKGLILMKDRRSCGDDEQSCCKMPTDYQCPGNGVCISATQLCDGWEQCADGADESPEVCVAQVPTENVYGSRSIVVTVILCVIVAVFFVACVVQTCRSRLGSSLNEPKEDPAAVEPLTQNGNKIARMTKFSTVDGIRLKHLNDRTSALSYDRNHITGASSSTTNGSSLNGYPVPPPSPATIGSMRYNGYHPYKHYKSINQAPPPTPCSTDICDESDSNYTSRSNKSYRSIKTTSKHREPYAEPYAPPSTPRYYNSHGSCPPSPGSRSSTDFKYQPPCPSPVH